MHLSYLTGLGRKVRGIATVILVFSGLCSAQVLNTVQQTGPSSNRVDIALLGDGYTADQMGQFHTDVQRYINYVFAGNQAPYPRYANYFNIHAVEIASAESGADKPDVGVYVDTALGASFGKSMTRLLTVDSSLANAAMYDALAGTDIDVDIKAVAVNTSTYGGSGGIWGVWAGSNSQAGELALHETAHSFASLADEYAYTTSTYTGGEPYEPNVTADAAGAKWEHWLGYQDPDYSISAVGVYEGAQYYTDGLYRPTFDSKMRTLGKPFNAVSREAIILSIYDHVNVLDDYLGRDTGLETVPHDAPDLWVDVIDPDIIQVDWYVDGQLVAADGGETFDLFRAGFGPGQYSVQAIAHDPTEWVRIQLDKLTAEVAFAVDFFEAPGDCDEDGDVDFQDFTFLSGQYGSIVDPYSQGDFTGDGLVGPGDLALLEDYMGVTYTLSMQSAAVPEPASWAVLALGASALYKRRR